MKRPKLLTIDGQPKTSKGEKRGYLTAIMHLAPADLSGRDVCPFRTIDCTNACLGTSGHGGIGAGTLDEIRNGTKTNSVQRARIARTHRLFDDRPRFLADLFTELHAFVRRAHRLGMVPAFRPNGTSDIRFERVAPTLFTTFPDLIVYDYTKYPIDRRPASALPPNYSLTMSYSGHNADACLDALAHGRNVATVFAVKRGAPLPTRFGAYRVIDGDETDLRFLDPSPVIVGLRAKGRAIGSTSPFVIQPPFTSVEAD